MGDLVAVTTLRFPFRERGETKQQMHTKFTQLAKHLNKLDGVSDVFYEEDERCGLYIEVEIPMHTAIFARPLKDIYASIRRQLSEYYDIDNSY